MSKAAQNSAAQKAIDVLTVVAEDENADGDTRIRAACAILDNLDKLPKETLVSA